MYKMSNLTSMDLAIALDKLELLERDLRNEKNLVMADRVHEIAKFLNDANK